MEVVLSVSRKSHLLTLACVGGLALAAPALGAKAPAGSSLEVGALSVRYDALLEQARGFDVEPKRHVLAGRSVTARELRRGIADLEERVAAARKEARKERRYAPSGGTIQGVSLATLEAIAACESGGDPTAVNPAGYYGKYQFDMGTWASVGGSGNPAEASEAEQDYRAALLYSRAGSSPWPICGA
jgi:soluble lytic murein transglycosylase-like protein